MADDDPDPFHRGFYDIPSDEKLRGMGYVELAALLASTEKGSAKYLVVEREKARRDVIENARLARSNQSFWHHPLMRPVLYVLGVIIAGAILVLIGFK